MNRRTLLKTIGVAAASTAMNAGGQNSTSLRKYKIVITGGHPGDPEYGCGGSIARITASGHEVTLLYMNDGAWETSAPVRIAEARKACEILKARPVYAGQVNGHAVVDNDHYQAFQKILESENPDAVITHWPIDTHPDHRAITNLAFESWKQLKHKFALYYYEVGEDTAQFPAPTHYVDISAVLETKKAACYAHASQTPDHYYPIEDTMAAFRGL
jgi:LmbE family N-acetylglucosaminyl deacetylase